MEAGTAAEAGKAELEKARAYFLPVSELARLKELAEQPKPYPLPESLPLTAIKMLPELFQPRGQNGMDERHVQELKRSVKVQGALEPVLVAWIGADAYLIDGHHRIAAYRQAEYAEPIPVTAFAGTVEEAVLEAGRANSRAKLPMDSRSRQDYAWRLALMGCYSKTEIRVACGVSDGQVGIMRRAVKQLGAEALRYQSWWQVQQAMKGIVREIPTEEELEARLEQLANEYADRLATTFSTNLAQNPQLAARAFSVYFGRKLGELAEALEEYVGDIVKEPEDPEADF